MSTTLILGLLQRSSTVLPLFDARVPAGFPSPALDHMEHKLSLDALLDLQATHTYVVAVSGDSMTGAGIFDGDHLIVSRAIPAKPGHVVVACLNGDVLVKRLAQEQGQFILQSENPAYSPRYILENDELTIWGVVTHSLRNHLTHG
ncbi:LexA family protein [Pseudomonas aeruginosa]|uniref:LexA family protein n=1 Tax=Pseudomonas aeruginosa TaxID=287 RepID=UPI00053E7F7B|nr:S24 family peptidase [Pseudomonas aeruginosa]